MTVVTAFITNGVIHSPKGGSPMEKHKYPGKICIWQKWPQAVIFFLVLPLASCQLLALPLPAIPDPASYSTPPPNQPWTAGLEFSTSQNLSGDAIVLDAFFWDHLGIGLKNIHLYSGGLLTQSFPLITVMGALEAGHDNSRFVGMYGLNTTSGVDANLVGLYYNLAFPSNQTHFRVGAQKFVGSDVPTLIPQTQDRTQIFASCTFWGSPNIFEPLLICPSFWAFMVLTVLQ